MKVGAACTFPRENDGGGGGEVRQMPLFLHCSRIQSCVPTPEGSPRTLKTGMELTPTQW